MRVFCSIATEHIDRISVGPLALDLTCNSDHWTDVNSLDMAGSMKAEIVFYPITLRGQYCGEEARAGFVDGMLTTILLPLATNVSSEPEGWFQEIGFGPCAGEGRLFPNLEAAEAWMTARIQEVVAGPQSKLGTSYRLGLDETLNRRQEQTDATGGSISGYSLDTRDRSSLC